MADSPKLAKAKAIVDEVAGALEQVLSIASEVAPAVAPQITAAMAAVALIDFGVQTIEPESQADIADRQKRDPLGMG
jgi:hypothetical protein